MGEVLPLAIGIAASPFPVIPAILLLFTGRPRAAAWAFLAGWLVGIGASTTVFVLLAEVVDRSAATPPGRPGCASSAVPCSSRTA